MKDWPLVWKLAALFEVVVILYIAAGIVEDWVKGPQYRWATWTMFFGKDIEDSPEKEREKWEKQ